MAVILLELIIISKIFLIINLIKIRKISILITLRKIKETNKIINKINNRIINSHSKIKIKIFLINKKRKNKKNRKKICLRLLVFSGKIKEMNFLNKRNTKMP